MKLPEWVPQVARPWNPAFQDVWESMTPNERRASFAFDAILAAAVFIFLAWCVA